MTARILAGTVLVLLVATACTLLYTLGDVVRWLAHHMTPTRHP